jgi:chorismate mutase
VNQSLTQDNANPVLPADATPAKTGLPPEIAEVALDPAIATITPDEADAAIDRLREQIDAIDDEIVAIVLRRIAVSKQIQAVRMAHGGRRREHSRELKIVNTYVDSLGRTGSQLALTLLELARGRD